MTNRRIYVIEAGWVLAGFEQQDDKGHDSDKVRITDAVCIRRWGTAEGIGQLALRGPTSTTVLDPCGEVRINANRIIFCVECPGWK